MSVNKLTAALAGLAMVFAAAPEASAQGYANAQVNQFRNSTNASAFSSQRLRNQVRGRDIGRFGVAGINATNFSNQPKNKPFQGLNRGPVVSPYLALSGSFNGVSDYYNIVQPQREFERARRQQELENERTQRAILANQSRLNQIAARPPFDITGDKELAPTGHNVTYQAFSHFGTTGNYFTPIQGLDKQFR